MKKLRRPYPIKYVLTAQEAHRVLTFFFGKGNVNLPVAGLAWSDIEFAQALLIEGVEQTAKLNIVVDVAELFIKDGVGRIKPLLVKLVKAALEGWFRYADEDALKNPKIARTVRKIMRLNLYVAWKGRVQDGDVIWNHVHG
jgi:hypothetical protein